MCVVVVRAWWSCVRACVRAYGAPAPNPPVMHPCIFLPTSHMSLVSRPTSHARHTHAHVQLCKAIPRGRVATYGGMAAALASSARAVGQVRLCVSCVCVCVCVCVSCVCVVCVCVLWCARHAAGGDSNHTQAMRCGATLFAALVPRHRVTRPHTHPLTSHTCHTCHTHPPPPPHTRARAHSSRARHTLLTRSSHACERRRCAATRLRRPCRATAWWQPTCSWAASAARG
jgi:hypothetical protein